MNDPILTFEARAAWYGVSASDVREVARLRGIRPVPRAPSLVAGLAEVHGRLVTLIDLDRLLPGGAPAAGQGDAPAAECFGLVLAAPHDHLGILVRSAMDVAQAPAAAEGAVPSDQPASLLRARIPVGDRLLNLLAPPALVARVEAAIRRGFRPGRRVAGEGEEE